jgi:16S rRNA processing protein RimM
MSETSGDLLQIGQVLKSDGAEGGLTIGFFEADPEEIDLKEPVFIKFDGLPVPFFIESMEPKGSKAIVRLTGIRTLQDAEEVVGKPVFAKAGDDGEEDDEGLDAIVGWTLLKADGTKAGTITGWEDIPGNPCIYVDTGGGEAMVPFHEDLILEVDRKGRKIKMEIPDGLV